MLNNPPIFNASITPQGRLTLTTVTPVLIATVSAATTAFYTPYAGNLVPLFDGVNMIPTACAELSNISTNSATGNAGPAVVGAAKVNDLFVWLNSGVPTLTRGPDWTNITARSAGTALVRQNGILLNSVAITNGPAASRGTYVGTIASNAGSTWDYIFGAAASGGTASVLNVWNAYQRVSTQTNVTDSGATYNYTTATIRQARASAGNQVTYLVGLAEDAVQASYSAGVQLVAAAGSAPLFGFGFDSTTTFVGQKAIVTNVAVIGDQDARTIARAFAPNLGQHVISANENGDGANANTFDLHSTNELIVTVRN